MSQLKKKSNLISLLICILFGCIASAHAKDDKYTLEDLRVLDKEAKYAEVIEHITDSRPSQRDDEWNDIVHRAAVKTLEQQLTSEDPYLALDFADQMLDTMRDSKEFMALRAQAVINGFRSCYRDSYYGSECTEKLRAQVNMTPDDRELAFKAGKLVRLNANPSAAVPFFTMALKDSENKNGCADEDVILAVESGIELPPERAKEAVELAFSTCFETLKPNLLEDFYAGSGYAVVNYCKSLGEKGMLTEFQQAYCSDQM